MAIDNFVNMRDPRRNATIGWLSMFQAKPGDATEYGYNITWYH